MRQTLRTYLEKITGIFEIILSVVILLGIVIGAIPIVKESSLALAEFFQTGTMAFDFKLFLASVIQLIIGVEFIKMLAKHSPASVIEVVLFVIAKRIIINDSTSLEMLLGVVSLALLFVIRKYLFSSGNSLSEGYLFKADTPISQVRSLCKAHIPDGLGSTLLELVEKEFSRLGKTMKEQERLELEDVSITIYSMEDGKPDVIEIWDRKHSRPHKKPGKPKRPPVSF